MLGARAHGARMCPASPPNNLTTEMDFMAEDVVAYVRRRGPIDLVIDQCPYCGGKHSHGSGGDSGPDFGYRAPHCVKVLPEQGHYRLVEK